VARLVSARAMEAGGLAALAQDEARPLYLREPGVIMPPSSGKMARA